MDGYNRDSLDILDGLIGHLRPIEHLFMVMGEVEHDNDSGQLAHACAEIGLALTARFREHMERSFSPSSGAMPTGVLPEDD